MTNQVQKVERAVIPGGQLGLFDEDWLEICKAVTRRYQKIIRNTQIQGYRMPVDQAQQRDMIIEMQDAIKTRMAEKANQYVQNTVTLGDAWVQTPKGLARAPVLRHEKLGQRFGDEQGQQALADDMAKIRAGLDPDAFLRFVEMYRTGPGRHVMSSRQTLKVASLQSQVASQMNRFTGSLQEAVNSVNGVSGQIGEFRASIVKMVGTAAAAAAAIAIPFPIGVIVGAGIRAAFAESYGEMAGGFVGTALDQASAENGFQLMGMVSGGNIKFGSGSYHQDVESKLLAKPAEEFVGAVLANAPHNKTPMGFIKKGLTPKQLLAEVEVKNISESFMRVLKEAFDAADDILDKQIEHFATNPAVVAAVALACFSRFRPYLIQQMVKAPSTFEAQRVFASEMTTILNGFYARLGKQLVETVDAQVGAFGSNLFKTNMDKVSTDQFVKTIYATHLQTKLKDGGQGRVQGMHRYYYQNMAKHGILRKYHKWGADYKNHNPDGKDLVLPIPTTGSKSPFAASWDLGEKTKVRIGNWVRKFGQEYARRPDMLEFWTMTRMIPSQLPQRQFDQGVQDAIVRGGEMLGNVDV